jgi:sugar lactone lactonase YvrE
MARTVVAAAAIATIAVSAQAGQARAAPACEAAPTVRVLLRGYGSMESVAVDRFGRLYFSETPKDTIWRVSAPGASPTRFATGIDAIGGMFFDRDGSLVVGYGDGFANGAFGNLVGLAGLLRFNTGTGKPTTIATGTSMSNGVAKGPGGSIFTSNDVGFGIDRVVGNRVEPRWSRLVSTNGMAVDSTERFLYADQTFLPAAVVRIDIDKPNSPVTFARASGADISAGLDGMRRDGHNRLYAAANSAGQVWKIDTHGRICILARGLANPSDVAFGRGKRGFRKGNLYVVGFGGKLYELAGVTAS